MSTDMMDEYRKIVTAEIKKLKNEIADMADSVKPIEPDVSIGRLSRMEAIQAKSISEANLRSKKMRLQKLMDAERRLDRGSFGYCSVCEEEIPEKRLRISPESTVCMDCINENM